MKQTLTYREIRDKVHILNYSLGQIMSFEGDDGRFLLANSHRLAAANVDLDRATESFFS
jgi:hypothetical protein